MRSLEHGDQESPGKAEVRQSQKLSQEKRRGKKTSFVIKTKMGFRGTKAPLHNKQFHLHSRK